MGERILHYWLTLLIVAILDQMSKWWISTSIAYGESRPLIDGLLWLTNVHNKGAAFSILQGKSFFFIVTAAILLAAIIIYVHFYRPPRTLVFVMGLISGGAAGNLIDRLRLSYVIDFIDTRWWPVFNIADIAIVIGGILFIIYFIMEERSERHYG
jgi:signal peptidase II